MMRANLYEQRTLWKLTKSSLTRQSTGYSGLKWTETQFVLQGSVQTLFSLWRNGPYMGLSHLTVEVSRSHTDMSSSVGLIWMRDQPFTETSTWTTRNIHKTQTAVPPTWFEPAIPASECPPCSASVQSIDTKLNQNLLRNLADEACRQMKLSL